MQGGERAETAQIPLRDMKQWFLFQVLLTICLRHHEFLHPIWIMCLLHRRDWEPCENPFYPPSVLCSPMDDNEGYIEE